MKAASTPLSWDPVRRGAAYCSPACGAGCTWEAYQDAKLRGGQTARALGPGWIARVHENIGWHWGAVPEDGGPDLAQVYPVGRITNGKIVVEGYSAIVVNRFVGKGRTPRGAFEDAVAQGRAERDRVNAAIALLEEIPSELTARGKR